jgi:tetratricopeptide (TPR) repeat protein
VTGVLNDTTYDFPRKPLAKFMSEVIAKEGVEKGIQFYKAHREDSDYSISETDLIVAGYRYLHAGNAKDAAEVFKLSIDVFPDKDNPYDSYAEALMTLGKNEEAIENYKKSLELNPNNNNAVEMLKKLEQ